MNAKRFTTGFVSVVAALGLAACSGTVAADTTGTTVTSTSTASSAAETGATAQQVSNTDAGTAASASSALLTDNADTHAQGDDVDYDAAEASTITLADGASAASAESGVTIDGDTITISAPGTYLVSGSLSDGSLVVDSSAEGKVRLVLDGADITNSAGAAVNVLAADEVVVVLAEGSSNSLADGSGYDTSAEDAPNAALFSMADLTIGGIGALSVTGNTADGITSKDDLVILGGTIKVTAADDGIRGKDYLVITGGTLDVTATGGDALKSDNEDDDTVGYVRIDGGEVTLNAGDDGIHAEGDLGILGGTLTVTQSTEGLEGANLVIEGGATSVTADDDGLNATQGTSSDSGGGGGMGGGGMSDDGSQLVISGGTLVVNSGGDGLDSNGAVSITGGTTVVSGPTGNGNGSLDANGGITVDGGTLLAAGSAGMAEAPDSASQQGWLQLNFTSPVAAGQTIQVSSGDEVIASYTTVKDVYNLVLAADGLESGQTYAVSIGGTLADESVGTFSLGGSAEGATSAGEVTAGQATGGGMGGRP